MGASDFLAHVLRGNASPGRTTARVIAREDLGAVQRWKPGPLQGQARPAAQDLAQSLDSQFGAAAQPAEPGLDGPQAATLGSAQTAYRQGYENGYRDGLAALEQFKQSLAAQQLVQQQQAWAHLLRSWETQWQAIDEHLAQALTQSVIHLAQQVLRSELSTHPETVALVVRDALASHGSSSEPVRLFVHPDDVPLVQAGAQEALLQRPVVVSADARLVRGDVVLHSEVGNIDARLQSRWQQALAELGSKPNANGSASGLSDDA